LMNVIRQDGMSTRFRKGFHVASAQRVNCRLRTSFTRIHSTGVVSVSDRQQSAKYLSVQVVITVTGVTSTSGRGK
jgi:hypothetical protein